MPTTGAAGTIDSAIPRQKVLVACAWGVHLYTALGAAVGLLAIYYAGEHRFAASFIAMGVATVIDSSDGPLARLFQVKQRVPTFDGSLLDNIVDYLTYTVAPVFLMLECGIIAKTPLGLGLACFVMLASVYGFCRTDAKTPDHYFMGFPNYWNIVAFYLYCLEWPHAANFAVLLIFAIGVFVPLKYIYPNRTEPLRPVTIALGIVWAIVTLAMLPMLPRVNRLMLAISLSFIIYYFAASFFLNARLAMQARRT